MAKILETYMTWVLIYFIVNMVIYKFILKWNLMYLFSCPFKTRIHYNFYPKSAYFLYRIMCYCLWWSNSKFNHLITGYFHFKYILIKLDFALKLDPKKIFNPFKNVTYLCEKYLKQIHKFLVEIGVLESTNIYIHDFIHNCCYQLK